MIDFSTLKGLTIPEGNVKQISDAQGNVLWSAKPSVATVTITVDKSSNSEAKGKEVYFEIRGDVRPFPQIPDYVANPFTVDGSSDVTHTLEIQPGTIIYCKARSGGSIKVNGVNVGATSYEYTVVGDVTLYMDVAYNYATGTYADMTITET